MTKKSSWRNRSILKTEMVECLVWCRNTNHGDGRTGNRESVNKHRLIYYVQKLELKK